MAMSSEVRPPSLWIFNLYTTTLFSYFLGLDMISTTTRYFIEVLEPYDARYTFLAEHRRWWVRIPEMRCFMNWYFVNIYNSLSFIMMYIICVFDHFETNFLIISAQTKLNNLPNPYTHSPLLLALKVSNYFFFCLSFFFFRYANKLIMHTKHNFLSWHVS